ncbi:amidase, partial [Rhizobiaceae sp. 2RAB30]
MIDRAEYAALDAIELARLIRKGEVAHEEVLSASLDVIEHVNPSIQAIADTAELKGARGAAAQGTLGGVPFLLKDLGV